MFWDLSPRELEREFEAARLRQEDAHDRDVVLAWQVVRVYALTLKHKRLPDLAALLRRPVPRPRAQSVAEQRDALRTLSQLYGGPLRSAKDGRVLADGKTASPMTTRRTRGTGWHRGR